MKRLKSYIPILLISLCIIFALLTVSGLFTKSFKLSGEFENKYEPSDYEELYIEGTVVSVPFEDMENLEQFARFRLQPPDITSEEGFDLIAPDDWVGSSVELS